MPDHLDQIDIAPEHIARWLAAADVLGEHGHGLRAEIISVRSDPSRHNIHRAARAVRHAESVTTGDLQLIANATATELENAR